MGMLVLDVETRLDTVGDNARAIAVGRRWRPPGEPTRGKQADTVGSAQIEIRANSRFEEVAARDGPVENLCEADFELAERDPVLKSCGPILRPQGPREPV